MKTQKIVTKLLVKISICFIVALFGCFVFAQTSTDTKNQSQKIDGTVEYIIVKGDTLYALGRKFNVPVDDICKANNLDKNSGIKIGQKIIIPLINNSTDSKKQSSNTKTETRQFDTYTVQKGDTFWRIAKINDISVTELKKMNNLTEESTLKAGQQLKIPRTLIDTSKGNVDIPDLSTADPRKYSGKKGDSTLVWPVKNPKVTYLTGKVSGVQLSAQKNETVTAIRAGTVMFCGNYRGYGQVVFVQTKTGQIYAYCGLGKILAENGQYLVFGDTIGTAGMDSYKDTSQIFLMVFQKGNPIDPAKAPRG